MRSWGRTRLHPGWRTLLPGQLPWATESFGDCFYTMTMANPFGMSQTLWSPRGRASEGERGCVPHSQQGLLGPGPHCQLCTLPSSHPGWSPHSVQSEQPWPLAQGHLETWDSKPGASLGLPSFLVLPSWRCPRGPGPTWAPGSQEKLGGVLQATGAADPSPARSRHVQLGCLRPPARWTEPAEPAQRRRVGPNPFS